MPEPTSEFRYLQGSFVQAAYQHPTEERQRGDDAGEHHEAHTWPFTGTWARLCYTGWATSSLHHHTSQQPTSEHPLLIHTSLSPIKSLILSPLALGKVLWEQNKVQKPDRTSEWQGITPADTQLPGLYIQTPLPMKQCNAVCYKTEPYSDQSSGSGSLGIARASLNSNCFTS